MGKTTYKPLDEKALEILKKNQCWSPDWSQIQVADGFDPKRVAETVFRGSVRIGSLKGTVDPGDGIPRNCGIYRANLMDVVLGNECHVHNVNGWVSNVQAGDEVVIENVGSITCPPDCTFGNGHEVAALNEGGGREVKITTQTSAQIAYLGAVARDRDGLVKALDKLADIYAAEQKSSTAVIGSRACIRNCAEIHGVVIGESAKLSGAASLKNGTVDSSAEAPTSVGPGVVADDFIFQKGASVQDGAMIAASLVGEGAKIGKQFSAENSLFFANCEGFHSEVCSVFAGPYTVTHHRSTLLIAGLFSFYNAGSGTNQSNHMYKLGPLHQGILERGCKTGSFSYLLFPCRVGAFTAVIGKHYANFDTSNLPFSYVNEEKGKSTIVPGMNFFTVGTLRDGEKWPARDRRKNADKTDLIIFDVLSPYTVQKMLNGMGILMDLLEKSERGQEYVTYNGIHIKRLLLKTCKRYYGLAVDKYFGDVLQKHIAAKSPAKMKDLFQPEAEPEMGLGDWTDVNGLLCSKKRLDALMKDVEAGKLNSMAEVRAALKRIYDAYQADEWNWFLAKYKEQNGTDLAGESDEGLGKLVDAWKKSSLKLINMVLSDAEKEFEGSTKIGFGLEGDRDRDFEAVRGTFEGNSFVKQLKSRAEDIEKTAEQMKSLI